MFIFYLLKLNYHFIIRKYYAKRLFMNDSFIKFKFPFFFKKKIILIIQKKFFHE